MITEFWASLNFVTSALIFFIFELKKEIVIWNLKNSQTQKRGKYFVALEIDNLPIADSFRI